MRKMYPAILAVIGFVSLTVQAQESIPIVDAHIHYSHDAWQVLPPAKAVEILRRAGLKHAFVSSSSDEGTQKLYNEAPDLVVPVLRPYRKRGELYSWVRDETVLDMLKDRIENNRYAGIGEFHAFGEDIELPVLQGVIDLALKHSLFLHAHSDMDAVERIFARSPDAVVLWAHSGFDDPGDIAKMLETYPNLWTDLAFRSEHAHDDEVTEEWRKLFDRFPERILLGTDTYTPERWFYVEDNAQWSRGWLANLPAEMAEKIAWKNAEDLLSRINYKQ
ncbi:MAG: putative TIM-barrel fold metal-dependent hydrolase [Parasphingorhabdus sp.]|jgi:predicted TIM-barrel fold metal-dependent hydrolase